MAHDLLVDRFIEFYHHVLITALQTIIVVMNVSNNLFNVFLAKYYWDYNHHYIYVRVLYNYCFLSDLYFFRT